MSKTLTHTGTGPVRFELEAVDADVVVIVDPNCRIASVRLDAVVPSDHEAAQLIPEAACISDGDLFSIRLPDSGGGATAVSQNSRGSTYITGDVLGSVVFGVVASGGGNIVSGGGVSVNGQAVGGAGTGIVPGTRGVRAEVTLPSGSSAQVVTRAGAVRAIGALTRLEVVTLSGYVRAERAEFAVVRTTSGDIRIGHTSDLAARSVSGQVQVLALTGSALIRTTSGDIGVHAVADSTVRAEAIQGDITISHQKGRAVTTDLSTVSGRSRILPTDD